MFILIEEPVPTFKSKSKTFVVFKKWLFVFVYHCVRKYTKELSFCRKLWFSNPYIFETECFRFLKFQTMNSVRSNNLSLNYQRFTRTPSCKDMEISKFEFVAKTYLKKHILRIFLKSSRKDLFVKVFIFSFLFLK